MKNVSIEMTWEGAAKEVAVGGEFNGWAPVPLACQQVTSNTKTHKYTFYNIVGTGSAGLAWIVGPALLGAAGRRQSAPGHQWQSAVQRECTVTTAVLRDRN